MPINLTVTTCLRLHDYLKQYDLKYGSLIFFRASVKMLMV